MALKWFGQRRQVHEESPIYRFTATALAAGAALAQNLEVMPYGKYYPYNFIQVTNNTERSLNLYCEGVLIKSCPPHVAVSIDDGTLPAFRSFVIRNESGLDCGAGLTVEVIVQRVISMNMNIGRMAGR